MHAAPGQAGCKLLLLLCIHVEHCAVLQAVPMPGVMSFTHASVTLLICQLQPEDNRGFFTKLLHFCISNWEKALVLGILITLIVLVSVKVLHWTSLAHLMAAVAAAAQAMLSFVQHQAHLGCNQ